MREEVTNVQINASAERVWEVLTDFASMSDWNPFIRQASGVVREGAQIEVRLQPPNGRGMTFKPTLIKVEQNREFRWRGRLLIPGIFDGEHYFIIEPLQEGVVRLIHGEQFRGMLVPFFGGTIDKAVQGFERSDF